MFLRRIFALSLLAFSASTLADTIDVNLRDTSAQLQYIAPIGRDTLGKTDLHAGILYANKNDQLFDVGVFVKDDIEGSPGLNVGFGLKAVVAQVKDSNLANNTVSALALGALVRYSPPAIPRLGFAGKLYVSPNIVTFGNADRYIETGAAVEFEVIPQAVVYFGYRKIKFGFVALPDAVMDDGVSVGVRMSF